MKPHIERIETLIPNKENGYTYILRHLNYSNKQYFLKTWKKGHNYEYLITHIVKVKYYSDSGADIGYLKVEVDITEGELVCEDDIDYLKQINLIMNNIFETKLRKRKKAKGDTPDEQAK